MRHIALIPARAGSKSIPNKNLLKLDGKEPLIERTIRTAMEAKIFEKIYVSTDIEYLFDHYQQYSTVNIYKRPYYLCGDTSLMINVVRDFVSTHPHLGNSWVWLLQPTSPFRAIGHMRLLKQFIQKNDYRSYISVVDVGAMHANRMYQIKNRRLYPIIKTNFKNKQELPKLYIRNGCYYIFRASDIAKENSFYIKPSYGVVMEPNESVNIDSPMDLEIAKVVMKEMKYGRIH